MFCFCRFLHELDNVMYSSASFWQNTLAPGEKVSLYTLRLSSDLSSNNTFQTLWDPNTTTTKNRVKEVSPLHSFFFKKPFIRNWDSNFNTAKKMMAQILRTLETQIMEIQIFGLWIQVFFKHSWIIWHYGTFKDF